jgi:hypothetical protein
MDIFGPQWKEHHLKVEEAWRRAIEPQDIVLMPGDFSWAMRPEEVEQDFRWLAALPGRKVLIKGNHDYWWPGSQKKLAAILPEGTYAIKKRALVIDGVPLVGVRGADFFPREGESFEEVESRLRRERHELIMSLDDLARLDRGNERPIALFHYPPFPIARSESFFTRMLEDAGCSLCLFGHLHTEAEWRRVFQGERRGVRYLLVSCDSLDFRPALVGER